MVQFLRKSNLKFHCRIYYGLTKLIQFSTILKLYLILGSSVCSEVTPKRGEGYTGFTSWYCQCQDEDEDEDKDDDDEDEDDDNDDDEDEDEDDVDDDDDDEDEDDDDDDYDEDNDDDDVKDDDDDLQTLSRACPCASLVLGFNKDLEYQEIF